MLTLSFAAVVGVVIVTGCSSQETATVLKKSQPGVMSEITYYAEGDKVTKQTATNVVSYEEAGLKDKSAAQGLLDEASKPYQNVEGLTHSIEYNETSATESLSVDFDEADIVEMSDLGVLSTNKEVAKTDRVSLNISVRELENAGYVKVQD